ncbi:ABC transporter permease [Streptomyces sp. NPDC092296]|uniref:ABC transporter permease n=1 Tax=Streptomyces sp. NPDC092296 TaxID=3366012 RepID=UPI00381CAE00
MSTPAPALRELGYWLHRYRRTWRGTVVLSIANPLLFLTAIGAGLGRLVDQNSSAYLSGRPYLDFIMPGLLAAAAMQTGYTEAAGPVLQSTRTRGNYRAAAATPLRPVDILHGHLLFIVVRLALNAVAFTLIGALFGAVSPLRALALVPAAVLVGCAFAAPAAAWAVTVSRPAHLNAVFRFVVMPLYMFSGTFFPITQLPGWLQSVARFTPLWHGVQLCRTLALGTAALPGTLVHLGYLAAMVAAGLLLGRRSYRRQLHP